MLEGLPSLQNEFKQPERLFKPILQSEHTFLAPSDFILVISPCFRSELGECKVIITNRYDGDNCKNKTLTATD